MKKILLSMAVTAISAFAASADEPLYTLAFGPDYNSAGVSSYTSTFSVTDQGLTFDMVAFNNNNSGWDFVRCGRKGNASVASITTNTAVIDAFSSIVINAKKNKSGANDIITSATLLVSETADFANATTYDFTSDVTALTSADADITINVTAPAANLYYRLKFDMPSNTNNGWLQINNVKFYGEAATPAAVATPVIEMVEGGEGFLVKMSCETEGAEIHYTDNGIEPTAESPLYTAPIECFVNTTFKAIAVKGEDASFVATFQANPPYVLNGFSNFVDFADSMQPGQKIPVIIKGAMTAIYQNSSYLFVKADEFGSASYMLVYGDVAKTLNNGDTFGRLEGQFMLYNDQPEISSPSIVGEVTPGTAVEPEEISDLTAVSQQYLNHYVYINNVAVNDINGKKAKISDANGNTCTLYNRFDLELAASTNCKIIGFVTINNGTYQIWPTEIINNPVIAVPTFNPESGSTIPFGSEITISAEEGTEIYCKVEGFDEDFRLYEGAEPATPAGVLTIHAYAKNGEAVSETVTATYTVTKPSPELCWMDAEGNPVTEVTYVIDGDPSQQVFPEPSGYMMGEPTITSSNPEVAAITPEMGIEVKGIGETTITLSVEESYMYAAESASFLLKVITKAEASQIAAPTFNPESGSTIPFGSEITISAEEGTEIYCKVEGFDEDFRLYEGAEPATPAGVLTIHAYAKKGEAVSETVTATYTVTKPSPELCWIDAEGNPVTEVTYVIDGDPSQQIFPEPSGYMMGEPTITSSNPEVAAITPEMGIEVKGVGETTITLSVEESYMYAAESASFLLKVITKAEASQIAATVEFSNPENKGFTAAENTTTWVSADGLYQFNATGAVGNNSAYPAVIDGQLRLYGSSANTITVAAPTGYYFKGVSFIVDQNGQDWLPTVNDTPCTIVETAAQTTSIDCGVSLPTAVNQVTIGCGGSTKHIRISYITFTITDAPSAIESIETEAADGDADYYNLQGVRIENPEAGLYIRRQGGKVAKVIIR